VGRKPQLAHPGSFRKTRFLSQVPVVPQVRLEMNSRLDIRKEQGQTMTEFAIVLPVLVLLVFAVIQFGILFNNYVTLTDAARAGARKAAVSRTAPDPVGATVTQVQNSASDLNQTNLAVTVTSTWAPASDVTVTATYPYSINLLGLVVASGRLSSKVTERVE
jgi:Flp pilus assembly protein TadG